MDRVKDGFHWVDGYGWLFILDEETYRDGDFYHVGTDVVATYSNVTEYAIVRSLVTGIYYCVRV